ncbi:MAG: tryptophan--tRNA ligase [Pseudomonadota bacterium]
MSKPTVLTGITTTGTPHLGNYVGAIRPAIEASRDSSVNSFFFLADYHALIKCQDPERVRRSSLEIAATWLALGLDPEAVTFYRQSDIPEVTELNWLLNCVSAKGLLNRAHAYKAAVDANVAEGNDPDRGVTMGLFNYPVLMAADMLLFDAHRVPVGRDQVQHIEMARDIAQRFNHLYGEHFVLPEAEVDERAATLLGQDGRKMSKSYDNTIPLFLPSKKLRKQVMKIVTNSLEPGEPKNPDASTVYAIYRAFADEEQAGQMHADLAAGLAWGEAKQRLFELLDGVLAEPRERYEALMADPAHIESVLRRGGEKARDYSAPKVAELRRAVGIGPMG